MAGNRAALDRLSKMVTNHRVPPSLLFCGQEGTGKLEAALNLAKALNCESTGADGGDACDNCPACLRIAIGGFPDVRRIGREGAGGPTNSIREPVPTFRGQKARLYFPRRRPNESDRGQYAPQNTGGTAALDSAGFAHGQ